MVMTRNVLSALDAGEFKDTHWVRNLLHRFADYYFEALQAYDSANPDVPAVWQLAHSQAGKPETNVLQNLFLGVNAHINYDLVLTLVDMLEPEWPHLSEQHRQWRYGDHCHVNEIISRTIDTVQDTVIERYSPMLDIVDKLLGQFDEWLISQLITGWRDQVWQHAIHIIETPEPDKRHILRTEIEAATLKRANAILQI
jgi:hypothetical protein